MDLEDSIAYFVVIYHGTVGFAVFSHLDPGATGEQSSCAICRQQREQQPVQEKSLLPPETGKMNTLLLSSSAFKYGCQRLGHSENKQC
uniref:Uncharacterized protein n=1 Tax=Sphaerodactylus townsendi TaxID=933632 RepID=A0ACB8FT32_9SAUR